MKMSSRNVWPLLAGVFFAVAVAEALPWSTMFSANAAEESAAKRKLATDTWVMEVKDGPNVTDEQQKANLAYQAELEQKGIKIIGGSEKDINTGKRVNGLVFFHAKSKADAQAIVDADPGVKNGTRIVSLREFEWNSGTMTFQMYFGDAGRTQYR